MGRVGHIKQLLWRCHLGHDTRRPRAGSTTTGATADSMTRMSDNTNAEHGGASGGKRRPRRRRGKASSQKQGQQKQGNAEQPKRKRRGGNPNNRRGKNQRGRGGGNRRQHQYADRHDSSIETRDETSAGGLVVSGMAEAVGPDGKVDMSRIYVALIGRLDRRGRLLWSMPKGHVEPGEHQWKTAEREVWEETGIVGEAFDTLGVIDYWFVSDGVRIHKTVHHNLLRYVDGVFNDEDPEVTEVAWVPMSDLMEHLAYADERKLARIACDRMPELARKEADAGRATPR
nr:NUDIX hydrolase [Corynebacterium jeddahense]